jgi:hypothetical protein
MDALDEENFVLLGGPLGNTKHVLLFVQAENTQEIETRLADDPWRHLGLLRIVAIERWEILLGKDRAANILSGCSQK